MQFSEKDLQKALVALGIGLEPIVFTVAGWYVGPYLNLTNTVGAVIGAAIGFGVMYWHIWRFGLMLLRATYDPEREDLRSLASFIETERHKILSKDVFVKIMGAQTPLQLLSVLKGLSLVNHDFYDLENLDEILSDMTDFSKTLLDVRARSPVGFLRALDDFNDFLTILCTNFAFRYEVLGDKLAKGYVVPPFKSSKSIQEFLREDLKRCLADDEVRKLYLEALNEALIIDSRAPLLALAAYSLIKMGRKLEAYGYARVYSKEVEELALKFLSIAANDLRAKGRESKVMKVIEQKSELTKASTKKFKREEGLKKEEDELRSFISDAHRALTSSARMLLTAKAVFSYLFAKWGEKVSLKLVLMVVNNEVGPQEAFNLLMVPIEA
jgi:hypothetical protein